VPNDAISVTVGGSSNSTGQASSIAAKTIHPLFFYIGRTQDAIVPCSGSDFVSTGRTCRDVAFEGESRFDVALLRLSQPLTAGTGVISLASSRPAEGQHLTFAGYGLGAPRHQLQQTKPDSFQ